MGEDKMSLWVPGFFVGSATSELVGVWMSLRFARKASTLNDDCKRAVRYLSEATVDSGEGLNLLPINTRMSTHVGDKTAGRYIGDKA